METTTIQPTSKTDNLLFGVYCDTSNALVITLIKSLSLTGAGGNYFIFIIKISYTRFIATRNEFVIHQKLMH
jgi:hypothetical protein